MKLNYKRTVFVGFAFFLICAFWQAYDTIIPKILTDKFGLSQTVSGVVMALDNVLGLFLLPLFGAMSDRCTSKRGKRTPFILVGTLVAAIAFVSLAFVDNLQLNHLGSLSQIDDPAALHEIYAQQKDAPLQTPEGEKFVLSQQFTEEEFTAITCQVEQDGATITNPDYTNYVVPARQACAWQETAGHPTYLILFVALLLIVLVAMATFRSPAVALMPDVTVKPLRSKANAVINLMGSGGSIFVLVLGMVFATGAVRNAYMGYIGFFAVIAGLMLLCLAIFLRKVHEPELVEQMRKDSQRYGIAEEEGEAASHGKLGRGERRSLIFLLLSVALWYMGYNAVISKYSVYADKVLSLDYNMTLILAQGAAIVACLPVGLLSAKIGRKKMILSGVLMLATSFFVASFLRGGSSPVVMNLMFVLAGIGWSTISVNSFPMVVEMCRSGDVGRYTGFYYTASMAAQTLTPLLSGFLMDQIGLTSLFPYATVFVLLSFVSMLFVRHGDNKPSAVKGLEAFDTDN